MHNLAQILLDNNLNFKTEYELNQFGTKTSFFGNLKINKADFIEKETNGLVLSYDEWVNKSRDLERRFLIITNYINTKKVKYIKKLISNEITKVTNSFSKLNKLQFIIMEDNYRKRSGTGWHHDTLLPITLDGYLEFLYGTQFFDFKYILKQIDHILWLEEREKKRTIPRLTILRFMAIYKDDILNNIIESTYNLKNSIYMLKPILKRSKLKSFIGDPRRLSKIVQCDTRHYNDTPLCILTQEQAIEFTKFYLESNDKRLNTSNIIKELILHLLKSQRTDLIDELCLKHYRSFSSVIAGEFTRKSYSYDILSFLRRVMSNEGYNKFDELIDKDENEKFSNAIKINFNKSSEVEADY